MTERPEAEQPAPQPVAPPELGASSASSPEAFRLRAPPPRVTRLSRKAMAVLGAAAGVGIAGSLIYGLQHRAPTPAAQNLYNTENRTRSEVVTGAPATYDGVPKLGAPLPGDLGRPILSAQQNGQGVPAPSMGQAGSGPDQRAMVAEQASQRVAQERDTARTSRLFLGGGDGVALPTQAATSVLSQTDDTKALAASTDSSGTGGTSDQATKRAFLQSTGNRVTASTERLTAPVSRRIIQAGSVVAAALITGIRSDLPGQISAQVTQNVYDSLTGRVLLIPQGARLIGEYDSQVSNGQNRVLLVWDRLILPDGRSILLDRQPGADASGYAGLQDKTNYHWGNMLRAVAVSTLLGIGTEMATDNSNDLIQALRYGTQDTVSQTGRQLVQREMNVAPTLTIRPGFPLRVIITKDLILDSTDGDQP